MEKDKVMGRYKEQQQGLIHGDMAVKTQHDQSSSWKKEFIVSEGKSIATVESSMAAGSHAARAVSSSEFTSQSTSRRWTEH